MGADERAESLRMIRDSAAGIAPRTGDFKRVRALRFTDPGFDRGVWREMCDMGWVGLRVPEFGWRLGAWNGRVVRPLRGTRRGPRARTADPGRDGRGPAPHRASRTGAVR